MAAASRALAMAASGARARPARGGRGGGGGGGACAAGGRRSAAAQQRRGAAPSRGVAAAAVAGDWATGAGDEHDFAGGAASRGPLTTPEPELVEFAPERANSVALIGEITERGVALKELDFQGQRKLVANLSISVRAGRGRDFYNVEMWDAVAQQCAEHMSAGDAIAIRGRLKVDVWPEDKMNPDGPKRRAFKVVASELGRAASLGSEDFSPAGGVSRSGAPVKKAELWEMLFADYSSFWDNRLTKRSDKAPDFVHKDSGDALWLGGAYPPSEAIIERVASTLPPPPAPGAAQQAQGPGAGAGMGAGMGARPAASAGASAAPAPVGGAGGSAVPLAQQAMWDSLLADPSAWWDNREGKRNPKAPDFKHKESGDALWLNSAPPSIAARVAELPPPAMGAAGGAGGARRAPNPADVAKWESLLDSPSAWWDNREGKRNPKAPDFKHKENGDALWLSSVPEELAARVASLPANGGAGAGARAPASPYDAQPAMPAGAAAGAFAGMGVAAGNFAPSNAGQGVSSGADMGYGGGAGGGMGSDYGYNSGDGGYPVGDFDDAGEDIPF
eukprot:PRCOL_00002760-RA